MWWMSRAAAVPWIAASNPCLIFYPLFARGLTANSPQKNGPGAVGLEVSIGGAVIRSGDLIVGDRDGVVVLPQEKIPTALEGLQAVREKERKLEALIAKGLKKPDWVKAFLAGERVKYMG